jgi:hypothetical protein
MPRTNYILPPLHLNSLKLGGLVTNIWEPHRAYHFPSAIVAGKIVQHPPVPMTDGKVIIYGNQDASASAIFAHFLSMEHTRERSTSWTITASEINYSRLANYEDAFLKIWKNATDMNNNVPAGSNPAGQAPASEALDPLEDMETRLWIQERIERGQKVYMITDIITATDPKIDALASEAVSDAFKAQVDIADIVALGGGIVAGATSKEALMVAAKFGAKGGAGLTGSINGEVIIGIGYTRVHVRREWMEALGLAKSVPTVKDVKFKWIVSKARGRSAKTEKADDDVEVVCVSLGDLVGEDIEKVKQEQAYRKQSESSLSAGEGNGDSSGNDTEQHELQGAHRLEMEDCVFILRP